MRLLITTILLTITILPIPAWGLQEICGNGVDDDASGTAGACPGGEVDAIFSTGCDDLCPASMKDQDRDGFASDGTGPRAGTDCDDTRKDIFPDEGGQYTSSGCSAGSWRKCQANGSYTACSSSDFAPDGCTSYRYIDGATGNNSDNGTTEALAWADYRNFLSYYQVADQPAGYEAPTAGRCYIFSSGTYTHTFSHNGTTLGFHWNNVDGNAANHIKLIANGKNTARVVFDAGGTNVAPRNPLYIRGGSSYIDVLNIDITSNYCDSHAFQPNAGCFTFDEGSNIVIAGLKVYANDGVRNNNMSGVVLSTQSQNIAIRNVGMWENFDSTIDGINNSNFVDFQGSGIVVSDSTFYYTTDAGGVNLKQKHGHETGSITLSRNYYGGAGTTYGTAIAGPSWTVENSVFNGLSHGIWIGDLGGKSYQTGTQIARRNTFFSTTTATLLDIQKGWDSDGTSAADQCSGDITLGTITFSENVYVDDSASYSAETRIQSTDIYAPDQLKDASFDVGKVVYSNNCYHNSSTGGFAAEVFASNNGDTTCSGRGNEGAAYTTWGDWTGAGYETGSHNENPTLDADEIATSANCLDAGWNIGLNSGGGGGEESILSAIIDCVRRRRNP